MVRLRSQQHYNYKKSLEGCNQSIINIKRQLRNKIVRSDEIGLRLQAIADRVDEENKMMGQMGSGLEAIVGKYESTEKTITGYAAAGGTTKDLADAWNMGNMPVNMEHIEDFDLSNFKPVGLNTDPSAETSGGWIETADHYMDCINDAVQQLDSWFDEIQQAVKDAKKLNAVVAIGISGSIGAAAYMGGAAQIVVDMNGNMGIQLSGGPGAEAGASAKGTVYAAIYPGKKDIKDLEGFGIELGGSAGEGLVGSASMLLEGEGDDVTPSGFLLGAGIGVEGTVAEGHMAMSETSPTLRLGNVITRPVDQLVDNWNLVYKAWKMIK